MSLSWVVVDMSMNQSYPVPASATGYPNASNPWEGNISNNGMNYVTGTGGSKISSIGEIAVTRVKLQDSQSTGSESVADIHGTFGHLQAWSSSGQNMNASQVFY